MPAYYPTIPPNIQTWCLSQPLFFTATAPQHGSHINISPKGLPSRTLKIFSPSSCAYIDATGSGAETIAHVYENGRITVMFCSFEKTPRIVRFFCTGRVVEWWEPEFGRLGQRMGMQVEGARAVVVLSIWKVGLLLISVVFLSFSTACIPHYLVYLPTLSIYSLHLPKYIPSTTHISKKVPHNQLTHPP